jgi:hypothetical protein
MAKDYFSRKKRKSRLTKIEEKRSLKQAVIFAFLTIVLLTVIFIYGIPSLIRLIVFLGDLRSTDVVPISQDNLAPIAPVIQSLPEATSSANIKIKGYTEAGTTVKLIIGGINVTEVIADKEGQFIFDSVKLKSGENEIKAKSIDSAGNESDNSRVIVIEYDNQAPELEILKPEENQQFFDNEKEISVEGETDKNITVYVNGRFTNSNSNGRFSKTIELSEGENTIIIQAIDKAGNKTEKEVKVTYNS